MDNTDLELSQLRQLIDKNDDMILQLFIKRMELVHAVSEYKTKNNIATLDASREQLILDRVHAKSGKFAPYAEKLFNTIMSLSRDYQEAQRKNIKA